VASQVLERLKWTHCRPLFSPVLAPIPHGCRLLPMPLLRPGPDCASQPAVVMEAA